jgi:citrate synthase
VEERGRHPWSLAEPTDATLRAAGATISALFDAAGAVGDGTLAERLARGWCLDADDVRAALILCADHELNTTAFTARCVASTDAPIHNALLAALCALEGRRHGGAADRDVCDLLEEIERVGVAEACTSVVERRGLLFGVGVHPRYPNGDPRARELLRRLDLPPTATAAQAIAFGERIGGSPTIELALAALTRPADLPDDAPFALFALGRSLGWVAHALEAATQDTLIRPRARYTGPPPIAVAR